MQYCQMTYPQIQILWRLSHPFPQCLISLCIYIVTTCVHSEVDYTVWFVLAPNSAFTKFMFNFLDMSFESSGF